MTQTFSDELLKIEANGLALPEVVAWMKQVEETLIPTAQETTTDALAPDCEHEPSTPGDPFRHYIWQRSLCLKCNRQIRIAWVTAGSA